MEKFKHGTHEVILIGGELYLTVARCHHCCQWSDRVSFSPAHFMRLIRCLSMHANEPFVDGKSRKPGRTKRELRMCQLLRGFPKVCTLWCQIRTALSLLGPVVEYPRVYFFGPSFSLFAPCDFYSDQVFHFNPPVVFIQTMFSQTVTSRDCDK